MVPELSRRRFLQLTGAGAAAGLVASTAQATDSARFFVHPNDGTSRAVDAILEGGGAVVHEYETFPFVDARLPLGGVAAVQRDDRVAALERDGRVRLVHHKTGHERGGGGGGGDDDDGGGCSGHPAQTASWGYDRVNAAGATSTGSGVDVAVLDTGLEAEHCDLAPNVAGGHNCTNGPAGNWGDKNGHGTHTAGIAGAANNDVGVVGVAPDANLYGVKVLGNNGSGRWGDVVCGLDWARSNGRQIVSMSLGGSYNATVATALQATAGDGILVVAAAGNAENDEDGDCEEGNVSFPATHDAVLGVSALDPDDSIAAYSSVGDGDGDGDNDVDLVAPGTDILSTWIGDAYNTASGTSMAAPHVSGVAALVWADMGLGRPDPDDGATVWDTLIESADTSYDGCAFGFGLVDAASATSG